MDRASNCPKGFILLNSGFFPGSPVKIVANEWPSPLILHWQRQAKQNRGGCSGAPCYGTSKEAFASAKIKGKQGQQMAVDHKAKGML